MWILIWDYSYGKEFKDTIIIHYQCDKHVGAARTGICWISPVLVMICCMTCMVWPAGCAAWAWACPCAAACTICTCWPSPTCMVTGALYNSDREERRGGREVLRVWANEVQRHPTPVWFSFSSDIKAYNIPHITPRSRRPMWFWEPHETDPSNRKEEWGKSVTSDHLQQAENPRQYIS